MLRVVRQHDKMDCGAACLVMIASYFGISIPIAKARDMLCMNNNGCSIWGIVSACEKIDIKATAFCVEKANDRQKEFVGLKNKTPFMANIITQDGYFHFIIVEKISKISNLVTIIDPEKGRVKITQKDFLNCWNEIVVLFEGERLKNRNPISFSNMFFLKLIKDNGTIIEKISILSLMISCFSIFQVFLVQGIMQKILESTDSHHHHFESVNPSEFEKIFLSIEKNIFWLPAFFLFICIIKSVIKYFQGKQVNKLVCHVDNSIMMQIFNKMMKLPVAFFETRRTGEFVTRFDEIYRVRNAFIGIIKNIFGDAIIILLLSVFLFIKRKRIVFIELLVFLLYSMILFFQNKISKVRINAALAEKELFFSHITKGITAINETFTRDNTYFLNEFYRKMHKTTSSLYAVLSANNCFDICETLIPDIGIAALLVLGRGIIVEDNLSITNFIMIFYILSILMDYLKKFCTIKISIDNYNSSIERLGDVLEAEEKTDSVNLDDKDNNIVVFDDVSFAYGYNPAILKRVSFNIKRGEKIAIVGKSGSGKSTIVKLIMDYYKVNQGEVTRGTNKIACLHQDISIFNESIKRNILLDRTDVDEGDFERICHITRVDLIARDRVNGFDTIMDEKGTDFSMGEKQRIVLARTLLSKPGLLILDEAGSALDAVTEKSIIDDIMKEFSDIAVVFITHRLANIKECDKVLFIENGYLKNVGKHEEIYRENDSYRLICDMQ